MKKKQTETRTSKFKEYREEIQEDSLILIVSDEMNQILRANLYEVGLNEKELKRLKLIR